MYELAKCTDCGEYEPCSLFGGQWICDECIEDWEDLEDDDDFYVEDSI